MPLKGILGPQSFLFLPFNSKPRELGSTLCSLLLPSDTPPETDKKWFYLIVDRKVKMLSKIILGELEV